MGVTLKGWCSLSVGQVMTSSVYISSLRFARHYEYSRKDFRFSDELGKVDKFLHHKKVAQIPSFRTTFFIVFLSL